jgi:tetratricopeptide (TPR) repeat protein
MRRFALVALLMVSSRALAADFMVAPPQAWVLPVKPPAIAAREDGALDVRLVDLQLHFDAAGMHQYVHQVIRVLQPQALQAVGTFGAVWQPATDKISFHRVTIRRGDAEIDVLKDGSPLQIIRREAGLEAALIDGKLTATMPVPDLRVGDEIEFAYTIDTLNPVLGGHRESDQQFQRSTQIDRLHVRNSWPAASGIKWRIGAGLPKPVASKSADGQTVLTIDQANFLAPNIPNQAPGRFIDANRLQTSDFADWRALSRLFAPIYDAAATPGAESPIKAEIARIAAASTEPKARALAALQLVQAQIRYLARMDGLGGYQPASADAVWKERLGDCKGKTVLLLALLRGLGIDAQAAIVSVQQSDGVDASLPMAGRFDHVIVRATIGGKTYWLDGTRLGDRDLDQIAVPGFQWALPLNAAGSGLERLVATEPALPTEEWTLDLDARDGISLPAKVTGKAVFRGDGASSFRTALSFLSEAQRNEALRKMWTERHDWVEIKDTTYAVDDKTGEVRLGFTGTGKMDWNVQGKDASYRYQANKAFLGQIIAPDRAPGDPEVPVKVDERYTVTHQTILLPNNGKGFYVDGEAIDRTEAGLHYVRTASVRDGKFEMTASTRSKAGEVTLAAAKAADKGATEIFNKNLYVHLPYDYRGTPGELEAQKKNAAPDSPAAQFSQLSELVAKKDFAGATKVADAWLAKDPKNAWALASKGLVFGAQNKLDEADAQFDAALAADGSNLFALNGKAGLLAQRGRTEDALMLVDRMILLQPGTAMLYAQRAELRMQLARDEQALSDLLLAIDKQPDLNMARVNAVRVLNRLGRNQDALAQAEAFAKLVPDDDSAHALYGNMLAVVGRRDEARTQLQRSLAIEPTADAYITLLNFDLATDAKTRLEYMVASIGLAPDRQLPMKALKSLNGDTDAFATLSAAYDKAAKAHPEAAKAIGYARQPVNLAFGHASLVGGQLEEEIKASPGNALVLNNACWTRATNRFELDKALADCDAAIALRREGNFLDSRGLVRLQRGEVQAAIEDYDAALALRPTMPTSLFGRGLAKTRSGKAKEGKVDLDAARKINPKIDEEFADYGLKP